MKSITDFQKYKQQNKKISMLTCYDAWSASILSQTDIDCLLVGDSVAMIAHGHDSTIHADIEMMALHTKAVHRKASNKFIVTDLPFMSIHKGITPAMEAVETLTRSGAKALKIEGIEANQDVIRQSIKSGVPIMGHIGLLPQSVNLTGGYRIQGKDNSSAEFIKGEARLAMDLGCFAVVLECIPTLLAKEISVDISIPTIGIGAGPFCDGQVLVLQDMLGAQTELSPRFVRSYSSVKEDWIKQINHFDRDIKSSNFPSKGESYLWQ